jgi:serine acetyltransferase
MGSVVINDVPSRMVVVGNPAKIKYSLKEYLQKKANWENS